MEKVQPLAENLGFMVGLNTEALPGVQPPKTLLQDGKEFMFH
jgi:hypothetical protein